MPILLCSVYSYFYPKPKQLGGWDRATAPAKPETLTAGLLQKNVTDLWLG